MIQITNIMKSHLYSSLLLPLTPGEEDNCISLRSTRQGVGSKASLTICQPLQMIKSRGVTSNIAYNAGSALARINYRVLDTEKSYECLLKRALRGLALRVVQKC